MQLLPFTIQSLHKAYADGTSPEAVIEECFRRIQAVNDSGIFLHLIDRDNILRQIQQLAEFDTQTKPLWGIPFAIKDNIDAAGTPTTAACPDFTYTSQHNAFVVDCLQKAGALLIGKTNLDQFATGLVGVRTPYPVPKNAVRPELIPGGSSSGSAVCVAHGIVSFALGTDTAGSGRVPAALNNIVGLKPSLGAISNTGVVPACRTLDTVSIFALTVDDAYRVLRTANTLDQNDVYARPLETPALPAPCTNWRIGAPSEKTRHFFDDETQAHFFKEALSHIAADHHRIIDLDFSPFYNAAALLYQGAWIAERYIVIEALLKRKPEAIHPVTRKIISTAETLSASTAFQHFYQLQSIKHKVASILKQVDFLCVPSIPTFYTVDEVAAEPYEPNTRLGTYTNFANLLDLCAITVPLPPRADGLPGSVTLLAPHGEDTKIAATAHAIQQQLSTPLGATNWPLPPAEPLPTHHNQETVAIAVVGAHMSGLPLNSALTELGGRFLYAHQTAACYRLYRLPGGPPFRPGLIRDTAGSSIDLEVWALPKQHVGAFIQTIPMPLGIGTLELLDGTHVHGFLCESIALDNATEITEFGGWRAYLDSLPTPSC